MLIARQTTVKLSNNLEYVQNEIYILEDNLIYVQSKYINPSRQSRDVKSTGFLIIRQTQFAPS